MFNCIRETPDGITFSLAVQPKSTREGPIGFVSAEKSELRWAVHAPAADGKANKALIESIASFFGVRKSAVRIINGEASRHKLVQIAGLGAEEAGKRLLDLV